MAREGSEFAKAGCVRAGESRGAGRSGRTKPAVVGVRGLELQATRGGEGGAGGLEASFGGHAGFWAGSQQSRGGRSWRNLLYHTGDPGASVQTTCLQRTRRSFEKYKITAPAK